MSRTRLGLLILVVGLFIFPVAPVPAAETDELAEALKDTNVTLQDGLKASEGEGKPISAKFEIEDKYTSTFDLHIEGQRLHGSCGEPKNRCCSQIREDHRGERPQRCRGSKSRDGKREKFASCSNRHG